MVRPARHSKNDCGSMIFGVAKMKLNLLPFCISLALAQSVGTFTPTGSMTTARWNHTATLLPNGKVLIVGGVRESGGASAELYDPSTGTFTVTGNTIVAQKWHTATLLADGRVLITDRDGNAELYDPSAGTLSTAPKSLGGRLYPVGTLLADGRVLLVQLAECCYDVAANAELYDPVTGSFTPTVAMTSSVFYGNHTANLLADGRILIQSFPTAALYDPLTGAFTEAGVMRSAAHSTATLLMNGKVLYAGGDDDSGASASAEVYDPSKAIFAPTGSMTAARSDHTSTLLSDGTVLVTGSNGQTPVGAEIYDPAPGTFAPAGEMTVSRRIHTATLLNDGRVLITGGISEVAPQVWAAVSSAEIYTPARLVPVPALLSLSGDGQGQGTILHAGTSDVVSATNPVGAGEVLELYCRGLAENSVIPPQVSIGGRAAEVVFFGKAPGYESLNQVNVRVPEGIPPGPTVPVRLTYLGRYSNEVTMGVK